MHICIFPDLHILPLHIFFITQYNPNSPAKRVGTTVKMTSVAATKRVTSRFANSSITVRKRNTILNAQNIMCNGANIGHISILIGQNISLKNIFYLLDFGIVRRLALLTYKKP